MNATNITERNFIASDASFAVIDCLFDLRPIPFSVINHIAFIVPVQSIGIQSELSLSPRYSNANTACCSIRCDVDFVNIVNPHRVFLIVSVDPITKFIFKLCTVFGDDSFAVSVHKICVSVAGMYAM